MPSTLPYAAVAIALTAGCLFFGWTAITSPRQFLEMSPRLRRLTPDESSFDHPALQWMARVLGVLLLLCSAVFAFFALVLAPTP